MTRRRLAAALATAAAVAVTAVACSQEPAAPSNELPHDLAQAVTVDAMFGHLRKLQEIADANGGNRAQGTPGYDASLDYVAGLLRDKGFEVETPSSSDWAPWAAETRR